ncbi:uncharacterized protein NPIL_286461 [Nephila pilipes]|uniref:Uncharacterized protein n=1 Tax=Nephila pilipes TaxID=299642 RepID=A0A8X6N7W9_NEPPI|nr:uncharacterized protein NPIL_286461 [Nephila pilipes]
MKVKKKKIDQKSRKTSTPVSKTVSDSFLQSFKQPSMIKPNNRNKKYMNSLYPFFGVKKHTKIKGFSDSIHQSSTEISDIESSKEILRKEYNSYSNLFLRKTSSTSGISALKTLDSVFRKYNRISNISPILPKSSFSEEHILCLQNSNHSSVNRNAVSIRSNINEKSRSFELTCVSSRTSLTETNKDLPLSSSRHSICSIKTLKNDNIKAEIKRSGIKRDFITDYKISAFWENKDNVPEVQYTKEIEKKITDERAISDDKECINSYSYMTKAFEHSFQSDEPHVNYSNAEPTSRNMTSSCKDNIKEFELHNRDNEKDFNEKSLENSSTERMLAEKIFKGNQRNGTLHLKKNVKMKLVKCLNKNETHKVYFSNKNNMKTREIITEKEVCDINTKIRISPNLKKRGKTLNEKENKQPNFRENASKELKEIANNKFFRCKKGYSTPLESKATEENLRNSDNLYINASREGNPGLKTCTLTLRDLTNNKTFLENTTTTRKSNFDSGNNVKENQINPPIAEGFRKPKLRRLSKRKSQPRIESKEKEGKTTLTNGKLLEETFSYPSTSTPFESPQVETRTMPLIFRSLSPVEEQPKILSSVLYDNEPSVAYANKTYSKYKQSSVSREERLWSLITTVSSEDPFRESLSIAEEVKQLGKQKDCFENIELFESPPCKTLSKTHKNERKKNATKRTFRKRYGANKKPSILGEKSREKRIDARNLSEEEKEIRNKATSKQSKLLEHFDEILEWSLCIEKESKRKNYTKEKQLCRFQINFSPFV